MATVQQGELVEFHQFLSGHLNDPGPQRTPEDLLEEWRLARGDFTDHDSDVAAIRAALDDMAQGDHGTDAHAFLRELESSAPGRMSQ